MSTQYRAAPARRVVVTGVGGPAGQAAVQALAERGYHVVGVDMAELAERPAGLASFARVPAAADPGFMDTLEVVLRQQACTWLFPTVCDELPVIARRSDAVRAAGVSLFVSSLGRISICRDKWWTATVLQEHGIAVPRSARGDAEHHIINRLGRPLVSRPRTGRGGRDVTVHDGVVAPPPDRSLIWQQFMPGTEYDVQLLMDPAGGPCPLCLGVFAKTGLREGRTGNATGLERVDVPAVADIAVAAAMAMELRGPIDMDIRNDAQGLPHVLEINPRIGAHALRMPEQFDEMTSLHQGGQLG